MISVFRPRVTNTIRDELTDALEEEESANAEFTPVERAMLANILKLREVRVEDVMIPRADVEALELQTTFGELLDRFEQSGHSRMPVYSDSLDDPRGMIHLRDVIAYITRNARVSSAPDLEAPTYRGLDLSRIDLAATIEATGIVRPVLFVPPSMLATDLMAHMQAARTQMALVIDEYGGTDGLASLEDIVEMIVGDIEDEHDQDDTPLIEENTDGTYIVDAKAEIDDVAEAIGEDFMPGENGETVDTIGGLVFNTLGRVPLEGEAVDSAAPGFRFHILEADSRRVKKIRIERLDEAERDDVALSRMTSN
nr:hemolysin family protein [Limoniibacter endophyticus]